MSANPKEARLTLGLTQQQMAKLCNTHPMTISKWETGERVARRPALRLIEILLWLKTEHPAIFSELLETL